MMKPETCRLIYGANRLWSPPKTSSRSHTIRRPNLTYTVRRIHGFAESAERGALLSPQEDLNFGVYFLKFSFFLRRLLPIICLVRSPPLSKLILTFFGLPQRLGPPPSCRVIPPNSPTAKKMLQNRPDKLVVDCR